MADVAEKDHRKEKKDKKEKKDRSEKSDKAEKSEKGEKLPKEIWEGVTAFEKSIEQLEAAFEPLLATSVDELVANKSPLDRAKIMVTSAYAINTLCYS